MKRFYIIISFFILISQFSDLSAQTFISKAEFPEMNRSDMSSFTIGDNIYSLGGFDSLGNYYSELWQYNTINDQWSQKTSLTTPALYAQAAVIGNKAYLGNYWDGGKSIGNWWEYDAINDSWIQKVNLPGNARFGAGAVAWNNEIYVIGGESYDTATQSYEVFNTVHKYSPTNDNWIELDTFIGGARIAGFVYANNNNLYVGMGQNDEGDGIWYGDLYKYDLVTQIWSELTPIPYSLSEPAGSSVFNGLYDDKIIIMCTDWNVEEPSDFDNIYVYDIKKDSWTIYPDAFTVPWRLFSYHGQVGSKGYFGQGRDYLTETFFTDNYEFDFEDIISSVEDQNPLISNIKVISTTRNMRITLPENNNGNILLTIQTIDGKQIKSIKLGNENNVDISSLLDGIYIWTISINGKTVKSGRVIRS